MYEFRPITADDLPLVRHWLAEPHVVRWWGNPDQQFDLVRGDLDELAMDQFIVVRDARPFAYLQCYDPESWGNCGLGQQPAGTRGIDQFIGEADMLDRGHGSAFIRSFIDRMMTTGTPRIITDSDPVNVRAIRAYEKAGFQKDRMIDTSEGRVLLMVRNA